MWPPAHRGLGLRPGGNAELKKTNDEGRWMTEARKSEVQKLRRLEEKRTEIRGRGKG